MPVKNYNELYEFALANVKLDQKNRIEIIRNLRDKLEDCSLKKAARIVDRAIYELRVRRAMEILQKEKNFVKGVKAIREEFWSFFGSDLRPAHNFAKIARIRLEKNS